VAARWGTVLAEGSLALDRKSAHHAAAGALAQEPILPGAFGCSHMAMPTPAGRHGLEPGLERAPGTFWCSACRRGAAPVGAAGAAAGLYREEARAAPCAGTDGSGPYDGGTVFKQGSNGPGLYWCSPVQRPREEPHVVLSSSRTRSARHSAAALLMPAATTTARSPLHSRTR
jgi:hypothetical protein